MSKVKILERAVASAFYGDFTQLRPVQEAAIEPLINGRNVVLSSGTGSGKTEAVLAPLLSRYYQQAVVTEALTILYIAPTKALVNDLQKRLYLPLEKLGLRVGVRHGDRDDLASGQTPHILVTTPESLEVLIFRKDKALRAVKAVVIDEVHILYNTQRGLQLSILLRRLQQNLERNLQWVALSATVGRLTDVQNFLFGVSESAVNLEFPAHRAIDAHVRHISDEISFLKFISNLTQTSPTKLLIFANSRQECERLVGVLKQEKRLCPFVFPHYSSLSEEVRRETEQNFSTAKTAICISTSTLELGIDIGDIDAVILWGVPSGIESFLQRIGRSNRRQNKTNVICLVPDYSQNILIDTLCFVALIDAAKFGKLPVRSPYELFGAVSQQCLSIIASNNGSFTRVADLCQLFEHRNYLERSILESILTELVKHNYLQRHSYKNQYGAGENLYRLVDYRMIYGNFASGSRTLELRYSSKILGEIPADNLLRLKQHDLVRFAGKLWKVRKLSVEYIIVEPALEKGNVTELRYSGNKIDCDIFTYNHIWQILHNEKLPLEVLSSSLRESIEETTNNLRQVCNCQQIPYNISPQGIRYFTFAGHLVNKAIALITKQLNYQADGISLFVTSPLNWQLIPTKPQAYEGIFDLLFEKAADESVYQALLPEQLKLREFIQYFLMDKTIANILMRLGNSQPIKIEFNLKSAWNFKKNSQHFSL